MGLSGAVAPLRARAGVRPFSHSRSPPSDGLGPSQRCPRAGVVLAPAKYATVQRCRCGAVSIPTWSRPRRTYNKLVVKHLGWPWHFACIFWGRSGCEMNHLRVRVNPWVKLLIIADWLWWRGFTLSDPMYTSRPCFDVAALIAVTNLAGCTMNRPSGSIQMDFSMSASFLRRCVIPYLCRLVRVDHLARFRCGWIVRL